MRHRKHKFKKKVRKFSFYFLATSGAFIALFAFSFVGCGMVVGDMLQQSEELKQSSAEVVEQTKSKLSEQAGDFSISSFTSNVIACTEKITGKKPSELVAEVSNMTEEDIPQKTLEGVEKVSSQGLTESFQSALDCFQNLFSPVE